MSERKSINKYYPPDYDPSKVPKKAKALKPKVEKVRLMAPYSMRCLKCNEYIAHRRKFNARKEDTGEKYMNFKILRFHIACPRCNNNISFKTNYRSAGFIPDQGAVRNYESTTKTQVEKEVKEVESETQILERLEKEEQENKLFQLEKEKRNKNPFWKLNSNDSSKDVMENLQDKLLGQIQQQEINEHLEALQRRNREIAQLGGSDKLTADIQKKITSLQSLQEKLNEDEDEELAKRAFKKLKKNPSDEPDTPSETPSDTPNTTPDEQPKHPPCPKPTVSSTILIKKKPTVTSSSNTSTNTSHKATSTSNNSMSSAKAPNNTTASGNAGILDGYGSSSEED